MTIDELKEKFRNEGKLEAVGRIEQAMSFYEDVSEFINTEFPHWSEDDRQVMAMNWCLLLV